MADRYLWMDTLQDDSDATWNSSTISYTTLTAVLVDLAASETLYIASIHYETQSAGDKTYAFPGAIATPNIIKSVDKTDDSYESMATGGGKIETTGANWIRINGSILGFGAKFVAGDGAGSGEDVFLYAGDGNAQIWSNSWFAFDREFKTDGNLGADCFIRLIDNCTLEVLAGGVNVDVKIKVCRFEWEGGTFLFNGTSIGAAHFLIGDSGRSTKATIADIDMSSLPTGENLVSMTYDTLNDVQFRRCKLPATTGMIAAAPTNMAGSLKVHSCTDSDILYQLFEQYYDGDIEHDTYCNLGADYSAKMTTNTHAIEYIAPLRFKLCEVYCTANPTITVNIIHDSQGTGTSSGFVNDEFWIEVEAPVASTDLMLGKLWTTKPAYFDTAVTQLTDNTEAWTDGGLGTPIKEQASISVTGGGAGVHTVWANLAIASKVAYVDPVVVIS